MFQKNTTVFGLLTLLLSAAACSKDEATPEAPFPVSAVINSAQQVPTAPDSTVTSPATGTMSGTYTPAEHKLTYTVTYQGFRAGKGPTSGHFHLGGPTENGGVFVTLPNVGTSPISGSATLTDAQADALRGNRVYVNLHTARYPNGEIRGNVRK